MKRSIKSMDGEEKDEKRNEEAFKIEKATD